MMFFKQKKAFIFSLVFLVFFIGFISYQFSLGSITHSYNSLSNEMIETNHIFFLQQEISTFLLQLYGIETIEASRDDQLLTLLVTGEIRPNAQTVFTDFQTAVESRLQPVLDISELDTRIHFYPFGTGISTSANQVGVHTNETVLESLSLTVRTAELLTVEPGVIVGSPSDTLVRIHTLDDFGVDYILEEYIDLSQSSGYLKFETSQGDVEYFFDANQLRIVASEFRVEEVEMSYEDSRRAIAHVQSASYQGRYIDFNGSIVLFRE